MDSEYQCMDGESYIIGTKVKIVEKNTWQKIKTML
jgi:hypothetical protein